MNNEMYYREEASKAYKRIDELEKSLAILTEEKKQALNCAKKFKRQLRNLRVKIEKIVTWTPIKKYEKPKNVMEEI